MLVEIQAIESVSELLLASTNLSLSTCRLKSLVMISFPPDDILEILVVKLLRNSLTDVLDGDIENTDVYCYQILRSVQDNSKFIIFYGDLEFRTLYCLI